MTESLLTALLLGIAPLPAAPATPAPFAAADDDEIVITGYAKRHKFSGKQLQKAAKVYAARKAAYAPASQLFFVVKRKGGGDPGDIRLSLRSASKEAIPVPLDATSRFVLPAFPKGKWELVANRGSGALEISPLVVSPGTTATDLRLGDKRLECEVAWAAFIKPELPLLLRAPAAAVNVCRMANFGLYQDVGRPIKTASVVSAGATTPVQLSKDRLSFRYPGYDKRLPNSARVRFSY